MVVACRVLAAEPGEDKATVMNVVFMGMGGRWSAGSCLYVDSTIPRLVRNEV